MSTRLPYAPIRCATNVGHSNYNGLQATPTYRASHGLTLTAGNTYSHAFDGADFRLVSNSLNPEMDYGNAVTFDVRHHFTFTASSLIPGKESRRQSDALSRPDDIRNTRGRLTREESFRRVRRRLFKSGFRRLLLDWRLPVKRK